MLLARLFHAYNRLFACSIAPIHHCIYLATLRLNMSDIEKAVKPDDPKDSDSYEGLPSVDSGVYSGKQSVGEPSSRWVKFDELNRKLEHKMGIESVSI